MIDSLFETVEIFSPLMVLAFGLVIGIQHAFESDHVIAVSTQLSKLKLENQSVLKSIQNGISKSSVLGMVWGAGHTTTIVLIGILVYVLAISINDHVFLGFEIAVGLMLVLLGLLTIVGRKIKKNLTSVNNDRKTELEKQIKNDQKYFYKSYVIGLVHGLAGSGSLIILTTLSLETPAMIVGFLLIFGAGSLIGMTVIGSIIGIPLSLKKEKINKKIIQAITGICSIIIGINIIYQNWFFF